MRRGDVAEVRTLLAAHKDDLTSDELAGLLHMAATLGSPTFVIVSLDAGASIDAPDGAGMGMRALHFAAITSEGDPEATVHVLIARGADPNTAEVQGLTPLDLAVKWRKDGMARALIDAGGRFTQHHHHADFERWKRLSRPGGPAGHAR